MKYFEKKNVSPLEDKRTILIIFRASGFVLMYENVNIISCFPFHREGKIIKYTVSLLIYASQSFERKIRNRRVSNYKFTLVPYTYSVFCIKYKHFFVD